MRLSRCLTVSVLAFSLLACRRHRATPPPVQAGEYPAPEGRLPSGRTQTVDPRRSSMSESERKAAARAAFAEGVELQDKKEWGQALKRFEQAQALFDAPTHLQHIAECQSGQGLLADSLETYEVLARVNLPPDAPAAFINARDAGKAGIAALRPRVPQLRVQLLAKVSPSGPPAAVPPSSFQHLIVQVNSAVVPNEVVGSNRTVNPGRYIVQAQAMGYHSKPVVVLLGEGDVKNADVLLTP